MSAKRSGRGPEGLGRGTDGRGNKRPGSKRPGSKRPGSKSPGEVEKEAPEGAAAAGMRIERQNESPSLHFGKFFLSLSPQNNGPIAQSVRAADS